MYPSDLQLPSQFEAYRAGQSEAILEIATSDKRFTLLSAPTGSGKTLIYISLARLMGWRVLVLVGNKPLQSQIVRDFGPIGAALIKGRANYPCVELGNGQGCDAGPCHFGVSCELMNGGCYYYDARAAAAKAPIVVANYAYLISMLKHVEFDLLGKFDLVVLDEAHTAPEWLVRMCTIKLNKSVVKRYTGIAMPPVGADIAIWADWAVKADKLAAEKYASVRSSTGSRVYSTLRDITSLRSKFADLMIAGNEPDPDEVFTTQWIVERSPGGVEITPVWAHEFAEKYIFHDVDRVLLTSATLTKGVARKLGIPPRHSDIIDVDSTFNKDNRPFTYIPTVRVHYNMTDNEVRLWLHRIDEIIGKRLGRKGIIHTVSYDRARYIVENSAHRQHMIMHGSKDLRNKVESFKRSRAPSILVSPSIEEGFDFPDDECRWQIIAKIPFIPTQDPVTKARVESNKQYVIEEASLRLVQMVGRGMRSREDWCENFIIDNQWSWFRGRGDFPQWFRESWRRSALVPPPLTVVDGKPTTQHRPVIVPGR